MCGSYLERNRNCSSSKESWRVLGVDRDRGREDGTKTEAEPAMQRGAGKRDKELPKGKEG